MRILIVDDSEQMRRTIRGVVGDLVEEAFEAGDGAGVLEACRVCRPDWVLMDVRMEGLDGISATRLLKSAFPETNVLVMTSFDDPGVRDAAEAAGARAFVLKDDLLALRRILSAT
jgi:two-component system, NarL family, response regulator LiaR